MIQTILNKLLSFYPPINPNNITIQQTEYDENCYEVFEKEAPFLSITFTDENLLKDFAIEDGYFPGNQTFAKDDILQKSIAFVDTLLKDDQESLHVSCIIDFDDFWLVEFVRKDPYLNLELPNSGASIYLNKNGVITSANFEVERIGIEKPEPKISADEAKALYLDNLILTPAIIKFDSDYIGGDDAYHFVYYVADNIMAIEMDGTLQTIETYGAKQPEYKTITPAKNIPKNLYEAIGIPDNFTKIHGDGDLEQWTPIVVDEYGDDNLLEIEYDEFNNLCSVHFMPDDKDFSNVFSQEEALEKAISFLAFHFKNASTYFRLLSEEHELLYDDENPKIYAYQFSFQQFERDVLVATEPISITIDAENLMVTHFSANETHYIYFSAMDLTCTYPKNLAKQAYADKLAIEMTWSKEVDEDPVVFKLIYSTVFPETVGSMRAIDAKTGKTWFIDASYMDEFE